MLIKLIEPIFDELSNATLLNKCTHGLTQNVNEFLNKMIWKRCPKTTYLKQETVAHATYLAFLKFNDGDINLLKILSELGITTGMFPSKGAQECDHLRIKLSAKKSWEKVKKQRNTLERVILTMLNIRKELLIKLAIFRPSRGIIQVT